MSDLTGMGREQALRAEIIRLTAELDSLAKSVIVKPEPRSNGGLTTTYRLEEIDDFSLTKPWDTNLLNCMNNINLLIDEEHSLKLTLNELIALCDYPTFGGRASVSNYPEYNDVVDKIYEFVHQHRNE